MYDNTGDILGIDIMVEVYQVRERVLQTIVKPIWAVYDFLMEAKEIVIEASRN